MADNPRATQGVIHAVLGCDQSPELSPQITIRSDANKPIFIEAQRQAVIVGPLLHRLQGSSCRQPGAEGGFQLRGQVECIDRCGGW